MSKNGFEPRVVVFACNWCSYAGADLAGVSRIQYPPTTRIVRVMCSSRIDPTFILKAFLYGADGVLVAGCHLGDCHYIEGNYNTEKRMKKMPRPSVNSGCLTRLLSSTTSLSPKSGSSCAGSGNTAGGWQYSLPILTVTATAAASRRFQTSSAAPPLWRRKPIIFKRPAMSGKS